MNAMSQRIVSAPAALVPQNYDELRNLAKAVYDGGLAPKGLKNVDAIFVCMQHGMEIGLKPMQSLKALALIDNVLCVYGDFALTLVRQHADFEGIKETFNEKKMTATCLIKRKGEKDAPQSFSEETARKAGLWGKEGFWTLYPERMLKMRARSWAMRDVFPDALLGMSLREEVMDYEEISDQTSMQPAPPTPPAITKNEDLDTDLIVIKSTSTEKRDLKSLKPPTPPSPIVETLQSENNREVLQTDFLGSLDANEEYNNFWCELENCNDIEVIPEIWEQIDHLSSEGVFTKERLSKLSELKDERLSVLGNEANEEKTY